MRRSSSLLSHIDVGSGRSQRHEDDSVSSRGQEEKERRRREWLIQQERERQHEIRKQKMILEYEKKRALKQLNISKQDSSSCEADKDFSSKRSPASKRGTSSDLPMSKRLEESCGTGFLFKGSEGTQINVSDLRGISINIHRNIPTTATSSELLREVVNPEDLVLPRRNGEGTKPIFEREKLKREPKTNEIEEHRTVTNINAKRPSVLTSSIAPRYQTIEEVTEGPDMKPSSSLISHIDVGSGRSQRQEDDSVSSRGQEEKERQCERKRAIELLLNISQQGSWSHDADEDSNSKKCPASKHGSSSDLPMSKRLEESCGTGFLLKGPEGIQVNVSDLCGISINIRRNIPTTATSSELLREVVNPEDLVLPRRDGEGTKPLFEREELMREPKTNEIEEHQRVTNINTKRPTERTHSSRRRSVSSSTPRSRSRQRSSFSQHPRRADPKYCTETSDDRRSYRSPRERSRSRERNKEHRKRYKEKDVTEDSTSHRADENRSRERRTYRARSYSRERERHNRDHDSYYHRSSRDEKYHDYRERSRERSRERRVRERSRERISPAHHYIEPVPIPFYYENFHPRPMIMGPMIPFRGPGHLMRGRYPPIMGHVRPPPPLFVPRMMPPNIFKPRNPAALNVVKKS